MVAYRFCLRETSYGRFSGNSTPIPPEALFILQALRLSVVYKSVNVHLGQDQDRIISVQIYLKHKYTYENAGFCILCTDDFKMLQIS